LCDARFVVGVGIIAATLLIIRSPDVPRAFGPPFTPSVARGVGSLGNPAAAVSFSVT
jgi:hypothetical protein